MKFLESDPFSNRPPFDFNWLYRECKLNDPWEGEDYEGTSVRALFKVLQREGYISGYQWAYDVPTIAAYVLTTGPMVIGSLWTEDMHYPDRRGFIHVGSGVKAKQHGGHAYLIKGVNLDSVCPDGTIGAFRIINSWGGGWGVNGCASISFADMAVLLAEYGEGCAAKEILK
jgi:C1A family cysteine protease